MDATKHSRACNILAFLALHSYSIDSQAATRASINADCFELMEIIVHQIKHKLIKDTSLTNILYTSSLG